MFLLQQKTNFCLLLLILTSCTHIHHNINQRSDKVEVISTGGVAGKALIIFNSGFSSFQDRITYSFAKGMSEAEWSVNRIKTSNAGLVDLSEYDYIVISSNTYWWNIDRPTRHFLSVTTGLENKRVLGLISAAGASTRAQKKLYQGIKKAGGFVVGVHSFWTIRPNDESDNRPNKEVAMDKAIQLGKTTSSKLN